MAEQIFKELKTKIALKYNTYEYWTTSNADTKAKKTHADYEPLKGEVCFCEIPSGNAAATNAPTVLFKVGDGVNAFGSLNWGSALAADVYAWAKKENPDWNDFPALPLEVVDNGTGKFVTDFTYADNKLTITRSDVAWSDITGKPDFDNIYKKRQAIYSAEGSTVKTVTKVAQNENGEVEITYADIAFPEAVDISGKKDKQEVYSAEGSTVKTVTKVEQNANGEVEVTYEDIAFPSRIADAGHADAAGKVDAALTINVGGTNVVFDGSAAQIADVDAAIAAALAEEGHPEYSIAKVTTTTGYSATYQLTKDGTAVGAKIDIPKDMVVSKGEVITYENTGAWGNAGTYIVLTLANATNDTLYIPAAGLIEYVTSGSTADSQVIVVIDGDHKVTATIGAGKVGMTELSDEVKKAIAKDDDTTYSFAKKADTDLTFTVTPSKGDAYDVTLEAGALATKDTIATGDIDDKAVTEEKLEQDVQDALDRARKALLAEDAAKTYLTINAFENSDGFDITVDGTIELDSEIHVDKISSASGVEISAISGIHLNTPSEGASVTVNGKEVAIKEDTATSVQGQKADSALQEIEAGIGLKLSDKVNNKQTIDINEEVIFILNANF